MRQAFDFVLAPGQTVPDTRAVVPYNAELAKQITELDRQDKVYMHGFLEDMFVGRVVNIKVDTGHMRNAWSVGSVIERYGYSGDGDSDALAAEYAPELPGGPKALP